MTFDLESIPHEIFKAYDIRGVVDQALTEELTFQIGQAVGSEVIAAGGNSIVIGRDGRLSGPKLASALAAGVQASGVNVVDIGLAPSPVVYYSSYALSIPSCIAITGSHNPPEYNGLKMVIDGTTLSAERIQGLKHRILEQNYSCGSGKYQQQAIIDDYITRIVGDVKPARPLKIAIDCGNGVAGATAPRLFRDIGCEVIDIFSDVDGTFPNHHPDPSRLENLQDLITVVRDHSADLGLAFDGDGDRLGVVSSKGEVIWPDRQMILFAREILHRQRGSEIIYDVKCSRNLPAEIRKAGGKATMWRTGHSFIKTKLRESGAALAGEMSGHLFFKERWYGFDDGVYAGARLIELLAGQDQSPQAVFDALPNSINTPELRMEFDEGEHHKFMQRFLASAEFAAAEVSTIDGLRADYPDGFGLVRASNTTPILVLRFEGDTPQALAAIQNDFAAAIHKVDPQAILPF
ncbi:MAG: phosphomannomutase/phosphoglucomutase [Gammaproteobacteria bacterium]|nr:phosphomannomutase/phosphoglucomutase [Gammaproteobacteria bacterium]